MNSLAALFPMSLLPAPVGECTASESPVGGSNSLPTAKTDEPTNFLAIVMALVPSSTPPPPDSARTRDSTQAIPSPTSAGPGPVAIPAQVDNGLPIESVNFSLQWTAHPTLLCEPDAHGVAAAEFRDQVGMECESITVADDVTKSPVAEFDQGASADSMAGSDPLAVEVIPNEQRGERELAPSSDLTPSLSPSGGQVAARTESGQNLPGRDASKPLSGTDGDEVIASRSLATSHLAKAPVMPQASLRELTGRETGNGSESTEAFRDALDSVDFPAVSKGSRQVLFTYDTDEDEENLMPLMEEPRSVGKEAAAPPLARADDPRAISVVEQIHETIRGRLETLHERGRVDLQLNLHPPELGKLQLNLSIEDNQVNIRMLVHDDIARQIVEQQLEPLRIKFTQMGVQLGQLDVRRDGGNSQGGLGFENDRTGDVRHRRIRSGKNTHTGYLRSASGASQLDLFI